MKPIKLLLALIVVLLLVGELIAAKRFKKHKKGRKLKLKTKIKKLKGKLKVEKHKVIELLEKLKCNIVV